MTILAANLVYTLRVLAAWWLIRQIKTGMDRRWPARAWQNWLLSVLIGAEVTFLLDYLLFSQVL